jgi:hypothetical protein
MTVDTGNGMPRRGKKRQLWKTWGLMRVRQVAVRLPCAAVGVPECKREGAVPFHIVTTYGNCMEERRWS